MAADEPKDRAYPLKRDILASTRLNFNHFWMKNLAGYLLHPRIPVDKDRFRLADLRAGAGHVLVQYTQSHVYHTADNGSLWASEVATALPKAIVDAVDISSDQFPPDAFRPSNSNFWAHDCFEPFPTEYLSQFDAVNLRFLLCVVDDDVADKLIDNVLTLLSYIQWFEPQPRTARVRGRTQGVPTPACDKSIEIWKKPATHSSQDWVHALPELFENHQLDVIAVDRHQNPDCYMPIARQAAVLGQSEYFGQDPEFEAHSKQLAEEYAAGSMVDVTWICVLGRKAI
ncbi:MAG: hypothetical protein M1820_001658 [Bogoriella megaspora]|nr:MAG: hypothetical protein M1820_001658 [Bogoriella megaspora]